MTNEKKCLWVHESISLWVCIKNKSWSVFIPSMCTKFGTFVHWYSPSRCFYFFKILIFIGFIGFFVFLGLSRFLWWNTDHVQVDFLWFCRICRVFRGEIQTSLKSNFYSSYGGKWSIVRLFYKGVWCAIICIFWDIALLYGFAGLNQC